MPLLQAFQAPIALRMKAPFHAMHRGEGRHAGSDRKLGVERIKGVDLVLPQQRAQLSQHPVVEQALQARVAHRLDHLRVRGVAWHAAAERPVAEQHHVDVGVGAGMLDELGRHQLDAGALGHQQIAGINAQPQAARWSRHRRKHRHTASGQVCWNKRLYADSVSTKKASAWPDDKPAPSER